MNIIKHILKSGIYILLLSILGSACNPHSSRDIPVPYVNFTVRPYSMDNELLAIGSYKVFPTRGYNGIIVYHKFQGEFVAYDLACPNDYEHGCTVAYTGSSLEDSKCCKSTFSILTGFPINSDFKNILHSYNIHWINGQEFIVTN